MLSTSADTAPVPRSLEQSDLVTGNDTVTRNLFLELPVLIPGNYIPDLSDLDNYIDATDGAFVDVIHTDQYSGIYQPIGN